MKLTLPVMASLFGMSLLAGCGRSPQVNFYALTPLTASEASVLAKAAPTVAIASVSLPELVDRPQLVVSDEGAKISILESQRWAEPLKSGLARILAENLSRLLGSDLVSAYPQHAANEAEYRLFVDIQRFEATKNDVTVEALWSIRCVKDDTYSSARRSKVIEPIRGTEYEAVVTAYSRAVAALSKEIAQSIRTVQTKE